MPRHVPLSPAQRAYLATFDRWMMADEHRAPVVRQEMHTRLVDVHGERADRIAR